MSALDLNEAGGRAYLWFSRQAGRTSPVRLDVPCYPNSEVAFDRRVVGGRGQLRRTRLFHAQGRVVPLQGSVESTKPRGNLAREADLESNSQIRCLVRGCSRHENGFTWNYSYKIYKDKELRWASVSGKCRETCDGVGWGE